MGYKIGVIEGDGIGPEVISEALKVLKYVCPDVEIVPIQAGYTYFRRTGKIIEDGGLDKIRKLDATLKGPLMTPPGSGTLRSVNVYLRRSLDLYANIRPFTSYREISLHRGFNFVIIRENTEGLYAGIEGRFKNQAFSVKAVSREGSERIVRLAVEYARSRGYRKLTAVHKANILKESDGLFREVFWEVINDCRGLTGEELFVDAAAYWMVKDPKRFQVIVTPNLYGDILSDLAAGLTGSLGLCGSAQIGERVAVFEPVHGTAPDIAGKGIANPLSAIMSTALMLEYLGMKHSDPIALNASMKIENAVKSIVEAGECLTPDLGGASKTSDVGDALVRELEGS